MYHRFNEHKYPSTNINMEVFKKHLEIVKNSKYNFLNPNEFDSKFKTSKSEKEVLITIDDAFESFYNEAWPLTKGTGDRYHNKKLSELLTENFCQDFEDFYSIL